MASAGQFYKTSGDLIFAGDYNAVRDLIVPYKVTKYGQPMASAAVSAGQPVLAQHWNNLKTDVDYCTAKIGVTSTLPVKSNSETISVYDINNYYRQVSLVVSQPIYFTNPGTYTHTIPNTVYKIDIEALGGGGGGGGGSSGQEGRPSGWGGGGGGAGTLINQTGVPVTANQSISITVGAGGSGSAGGHLSPGYNGGASTINVGGTIYSAAGGTGGGGGGGSGGGAGGSLGGQSGAAPNASGHSTGGNGGSSAFGSGGVGTTYNATGGTGGVGAGGGGGGGSGWDPNDTESRGGPGGQGRVKITHYTYVPFADTFSLAAFMYESYGARYFYATTTVDHLNKATFSNVSANVAAIESYTNPASVGLTNNSQGGYGEYFDVYTQTRRGCQSGNDQRHYTTFRTRALVSGYEVITISHSNDQWGC